MPQMAQGSLVSITDTLYVLFIHIQTYNTTTVSEVRSLKCPHNPVVHETFHQQ